MWWVRYIVVDHEVLFHHLRWQIPIYSFVYLSIHCTVLHCTWHLQWYFFFLFSMTCHATIPMLICSILHSSFELEIHMYWFIDITFRTILCIHLILRSNGCPCISTSLCRTNIFIAPMYLNLFYLIILPRNSFHAF
jgi:hypothetical protein